MPPPDPIQPSSRHSACPECGYPVADEDKHCGKCGEKLGPPLSKRMAEAAERILKDHDDAS